MRNAALILALAVGVAMAPAGVAQESSSKQEKKQDKKQDKPAEVQKVVAATEDPSYVIGEQDILDISVWKEAEVTRQVPVRPDGKISLPLISDVQAAGLTPTQLATSITEKLRKYLVDPQVTVIIVAINSRRIYLVGEVARAGAYPLLPNMTVLQALSTAGGFSQFANLKAIYVMRDENGKQVRYPFNYKEVIKGQKSEQNIILKPGDTIVVP